MNIEDDLKEKQKARIRRYTRQIINNSTVMLAGAGSFVLVRHIPIIANGLDYSPVVQSAGVLVAVVASLKSVKPVRRGFKLARNRLLYNVKCKGMRESLPNLLRLGSEKPPLLLKGPIRAAQGEVAQYVSTATL